jgi:hypothetical protein
MKINFLHHEDDTTQEFVCAGMVVVPRRSPMLPVPRVGDRVLHKDGSCWEVKSVTWDYNGPEIIARVDLVTSLEGW